MELKFVVEELDEEIEQFAERLGLPPTRGRVLALLKARKSKAEIAEHLGVTEQTVQNHIQDLRSEIASAEELLDVAGRTHYGDSDLFREFGGSLWLFRTGLKYSKNEDTDIEKKLYGTPYGEILLVEREVTEHHGKITESRTRTEFHSGSDLVPHLLRGRRFESVDIARLYTEFLARSGIDPKHDPSKLAENPNDEQTREISENDGWLTFDS